jgi:hypothetical protein
VETDELCNASFHVRRNQTILSARTMSRSSMVLAVIEVSAAVDE